MMRHMAAVTVLVPEVYLGRAHGQIVTIHVPTALICQIPAAA
jgi:hypothetical protein